MALSQSARATTAAEGRFRVRTPNSLPRRLTVIALDPAAASLAETLASRSWRGATFLSAPPAAQPDGSASFSHWLHGIAGEAVDVVETVGSAEIVQFLTTSGHDTPAISLIGEACALRGVKTSGLVIDESGADPGALSRSLLALRPWVMTLSVIGRAADVDEILHALGA